MKIGNFAVPNCWKMMTKRLNLLFLCVWMISSILAADGLPIVRITISSPLNAQNKVPAQMQAGDYNGSIGIKLRGNSSLSFNQKKYTIELRDNEGKEYDFPLLGMPAHSQWVLLAPYNDVSMLRDPLAFQLWRDMALGTTHTDGATLCRWWLPGHIYSLRGY